MPGENEIWSGDNMTLETGNGGSLLYTRTWDLDREEGETVGTMRKTHSQPTPSR